MDQSRTLQILDSELKKIRYDTSKVLNEFRTVKKDTQEMMRDLLYKTQTSQGDVPFESEELDKEIAELEKELLELEIACSKEANMLELQQKNVEDQEREMRMMTDFKIQYNQRLAKASAKPSKKDVEIVEKCKKKLEAYAKMTGVVWDFETCDKKKLSGFIQNARGTKLKLFNINIDGKNREEIADEMWKLIKKYSTA